jgi:hypothetical protein
MVFSLRNMDKKSHHKACGRGRGAIAQAFGASLPVMADNRTP